MVLILDTHTLLWFMTGGKLVGKRALDFIEKTDYPLVIPSIVLAEIKHLAARERISVPFSRVLDLLQDDSRFLIYPLDLDVLEIMPTNLEIHDAIICGTAIVYDKILEEDVIVLTKDEAIRKSGIVKTAW
jgi:PIN domain nuclease of toxin-antitoxin system